MRIIQADIDFLRKSQEEMNKKFCEDHGITYYPSHIEKGNEEDLKKENIILDFDLD